ncbi:hypothetical protein acdb102_09810 [Acidothermaceae bacterium B102]|nr:hypothetical protein acdb102_09810 [Acidothermaceae bacterium B102]
MTSVGNELPIAAAPTGLDGGGRSLARGSLVVALGLGITGAGTLLMLAIVDYKLPGKNAQAAFNVWWVVTTLLILPFGVFEAYLARLTVAERAAGRDPAPVIGTLLGRTLMVAAGISVGALCAGPWLTSTQFNHDVGLTLLLPLWVVVVATQAAQRGAATGLTRFPAIAVQLGTDGVLRVAITAAIAFSGQATPDRLALGTCVAAAAGVVAGGLACPEWYVRPRLHAAGVEWAPVLLLLAGSVCPVLASSGPVPWLRAAGHVDSTTIVVFSAAVTISRIPTQFVSAAFGPLLSHLTHAAETGDRATFRRLSRIANLGAAVLGAAFVAVFAVVGVWFLPRYTNTPHGYLGVGTLALLALASALMFIAVVQQAGLAAMARWTAIAASWGIGLVSMVVVLALPISSLHRAAAAPAAAILTALLLMSVVSLRAASSPAQPS